MFYDEGAVVVASSYTKVGGALRQGFRHDPDEAPRDARGLLRRLLHEPQPAQRIDLLEKYVREYEADGSS
jgi:benzoyl-CoA reductase subunit B